MTKRGPLGRFRSADQLRKIHKARKQERLRRARLQGVPPRMINLEDCDVDVDTLLDQEDPLQSEN